MSGNKQMKKQAQSFRGSSAVTSAPIANAPLRMQVTQPALTPAARISGDCDVGVLTESSKDSPTLQLKQDFHPPKVSRQLVLPPAPAAAAPIPSVMKEEEEKPPEDSAVAATLSKKLDILMSETSTAVAPATVTSTTPSASSAAIKVVPSTPRSSWVHWITLPVRMYTTTVYYSAGAAAGVVSAVRHQFMS